MSLETAINNICYDPEDVALWSIWKNLFSKEGVIVIDDDSGFKDTEKVSSTEAIVGIQKCTISQDVAAVVVPAADEVSEWAASYWNMQQTDPVGQILTTEDDSPIQINLSVEKGKIPFFSTRIYVPEAVCSVVKWFAYSEVNHFSRSKFVCITPGSRDEALMKFDLTKKFAYVKSIQIVRKAVRENWLLAEITEW